jgi:hypothetical protein
MGCIVYSQELRVGQRSRPVQSAAVRRVAILGTMDGEHRHGDLRVVSGTYIQGLKSRHDVGPEVAHCIALVESHSCGEDRALRRPFRSGRALKGRLRKVNPGCLRNRRLGLEGRKTCRLGATGRSSSYSRRCVKGAPYGVLKIKYLENLHRGRTYEKSRVSPAAMAEAASLC